MAGVVTVSLSLDSTGSGQTVRHLTPLVKTQKGWLDITKLKPLSLFISLCRMRSYFTTIRNEELRERGQLKILVGLSCFLNWDRWVRSNAEMVQRKRT